MQGRGRGLGDGPRTWGPDEGAEGWVRGLGSRGGERRAGARGSGNQGGERRAGGRDRDGGSGEAEAGARMRGRERRAEPGPERAESPLTPRAGPSVRMGGMPARQFIPVLWCHTPGEGASACLWVHAVWGGESGCAAEEHAGCWRVPSSSLFIRKV